MIPRELASSTANLTNASIVNWPEPNCRPAPLGTVFRSPEPSKRTELAPNLDCAASSCALPTKVSDLANELSSVEVVAPSAPSKPQSKTTLEKLGSAIRHVDAERSKISGGVFARRNRPAQFTVDAAPGEGRLSSVRTVSAGVWALDVVALAMSEIALLRARLAASEARSRTAEVELAEARGGLDLRGDDRASQGWRSPNSAASSMAATPTSTRGPGSPMC